VTAGTAFDIPAPAIDTPATAFDVPVTVSNILVTELGCLGHLAELSWSKRR
jgi:hypothetical protein